MHAAFAVAVRADNMPITTPPTPPPFICKEIEINIWYD